MTLTEDQARTLLRDHALRVTAPRLAVLRALSSAHRPMSHTEVLGVLGATDWDPATVYRNLVKLRDAGVALVASRAEGIDRYALAGHDADEHRHPHFVCEACGRIACLPANVAATVTIEGEWAASVRSATIQLRGACPDCLQKADAARD